MGAIKVHHTETSTGSWDGPANEARLPSEAGPLRESHAWIDPEGDPNTKAAYKFIHHEVSGDGSVGAANMKACMSGIGVLNGGMGGTTIPDADRRGVWNHLAAHMRDAKMEPPELKSERKASTGIEYRTGASELRAVFGEGNPPQITGHAAVFNQFTEEVPTFFGCKIREQIAPGAFKKTIQEADVRALFNHDPNFVLGRNKAGTLSLAEDDMGLAINCKPPDTQSVRDLVLEPMRRGDISQMSFGFIPIREQWEEDRQNDLLTRTLLEVRLFDVSVVTYPAYPQTDAAVRSIMDEHGVDLFAIRSAMVKFDHKLDLSNGERSAVLKAIETLSRIPAAPAELSHPAEERKQPPANMETLRRRLARINSECQL